MTSASDIYSLGCLLCELLTGEVPFHATTGISLRAHHLQSSAPSIRALRPDVPQAVEELVTSMLDKDPRSRPSAESVYTGLAPRATSEPVGNAAKSAAADDSRDPTRPFRLPLLAPAKRDEVLGGRGRITDREVGPLRANVRALLENDRPSEAIGLLESGIERAAHDPALALQLRHLLCAALFYAGEYTRAATLLDVVGRDYRKYLAPSHPDVLDCAYHAGLAYAEVGKPDRSLPQLRFYVQNASAAVDDKTLECRYVIAQMLAAAGHLDEARSELDAVRPLLADTFGYKSTQVRNLDKQIDRLR